MPLISPPTTPSLAEHIDYTQGITMERTPSGSSILSDTPTWYKQQCANTLSDEQAADLVEHRIYHPPSNKRHARILESIIRRDKPLDNDEIDNAALDSVLAQADVLFFDGKLSGRVTWEWSDHDRYQAQTIGHTALRCCTDRTGIETLVLLSRPILRSGRYDRRLLLSAFLHELVHCYLFIMCGFDARVQGGHTEGFERIVMAVDAWVGKGYLRLCSFKADLHHFVKDGHRQPEMLYQPTEWNQGVYTYGSDWRQRTARYGHNESHVINNFGRACWLEAQVPGSV